MAGFLEEFARGALSQANENMREASKRKAELDAKRIERLELAKYQEQQLVKQYELRRQEIQMQAELEQQAKQAEIETYKSIFFGDDGDVGFTPSGEGSPAGDIDDLRKKEMMGAIMGAKPVQDAARVMREGIEAKGKAFSDIVKDPMGRTAIDVLKMYQDNANDIDYTINQATVNAGIGTKQRTESTPVREGRITAGTTKIMELSRRVNPHTGVAESISDVPADAAFELSVQIEHALQAIETEGVPEAVKLEAVKKIETANPELLQVFLTPERVAALDALQQQSQAVPATPPGTSPATTTPTIPQAAIEMLRANPALAPAFEQKYGVPAAQYLQ